MVLHTINEESLTVTSTVGSGGSAIIYNFQQTSDGDIRPRDDQLYKKYQTPRNPESAIQLIGISDEFQGSSRDYARQHFAWPAQAVVNEEGRLTGVLIPTAPAGYVERLVTGTEKPRDLNFLIFQERSARIGIRPTSAWQKLGIMLSLARSFAFLEARGLVHEDPAAQNILWKVDPEPDIYLLDCDSIRKVADRPAEPLVTTVDWTDPRVLNGEVDRPDFSSNSYILALATARIFGDPSWTPSPTDDHTSIISGLSITPEIRKLIAQSITSVGLRPSVKDWLSALDTALKTANQSIPTDARVVPAFNEPTLGGPTWDSVEKAAIVMGVLTGVLAALLLVVFVI